MKFVASPLVPAEILIANRLVEESWLRSKVLAILRLE